jgi:hypothetical protein
VNSRRYNLRTGNIPEDATLEGSYRPQVNRYSEHHRKMPSEEEYPKLLADAGIEFYERHRL